MRQWKLLRTRGAYDPALLLRLNAEEKDVASLSAHLSSGFFRSSLIALHAYHESLLLREMKEEMRALSSQIKTRGITIP